MLRITDAGIKGTLQLRTVYNIPHLPYKCIPFQQQLYTHRVRTNIHRTPTNYRELIMNTIPLKEPPRTPVVTSSLTAEETGRLLSSHRPTMKQSQGIPDTQSLKAQEWGTESQKGPRAAPDTECNNATGPRFRAEQDR